jgi:hypothetical protein
MGDAAAGTGRAARLEEAFALALDKTVSACSAAALAAAYPTLAPALVATAHRQLDRFLRTSTAQEVALIGAARQLPAKLAVLDAAGLAPPPAPAQAPASTASAQAPRDRVRARAMPTKAAEAERLRALVQAQEQRNAALASEVRHLRQQYATRVAAIARATSQLDGLHAAAGNLRTDTVWALVQAVESQGPGAAPANAAAAAAAAAAGSARGGGAGPGTSGERGLVRNPSTGGAGGADGTTTTTVIAGSSLAKRPRLA